MSGGEETYLEAFVDQLSTLPHNLRRSLELLKSLDNNTDLTRLKHLHRNYVAAVERKIVETLLVTDIPPKTEQEDYARWDTNDDSSKMGVILRQPYGATDSAEVAVDAQVPFVPITQEMFTYTFDEQMYAEIQALQKICLQKADEKCAVASQAYDMIDKQIQKLDSDMAAIEPFLKVNL